MTATAWRRRMRFVRHQTWGHLMKETHILPFLIGVVLLSGCLCLGQEDNTAQLTRQAVAGDASAQVQLGMKYAMTMHPDFPQAMKWFRMAADQGSADGQLHLAAMYDIGLTPSNPTEAVKWYTLAAKQGNKDAEFRLGQMYDRGRGVKQDYVQAIDWYKKAIAHGRSDPEYRMGEMYESGLGVKQSYTEAVQWYLRAAQKGRPEAEFRLGHMYEMGLGIQKDKTEAIAWYQKSSDHGFPDAVEALKALGIQ